MKPYAVLNTTNRSLPGVWIQLRRTLAETLVQMALEDHLGGRVFGMVEVVPLFRFACTGEGCSSRSLGSTLRAAQTPGPGDPLWVSFRASAHSALA